MSKPLTDLASITTIGLDLAKHVFPNQAELMCQKAREMLVSQRTQLLNGLRNHLGEVGVIAPQGRRARRPAT